MSNLHLGKGSKLPTFPDDGVLRLYSMRFCPFAQRSHLVLEAKNIPYHVAYINLAQKPEWLPQISPLGKVPALELPSGGEPLIESLVIADYLDEQYPQNPLISKDPLQKARDRILVERFSSVISGGIRFMHAKPGATTAPGAFADFNNALDIYEEELKRRGTKFFAGDEKPGYLDYMIWPWWERTDAFTYIDEKYEMDKNRFAKLCEWGDDMKQDPAVAAVIISGANHFKFVASYFRPEGIDYDMVL